MDRYGPIWNRPENQSGIRYICGYCGVDTSPAQGWQTSLVNGYNGYILLCTSCNRPSFIEIKGGNIIKTTPAQKLGTSVEGLSNDLSNLYEEARSCTGANAPTAAVLVSRKILMHIAVEKGAKTGGTFIDYVNFLADKAYIPPDAKGWVDYIRTKSNEANHEIVLMSPQDANDLLKFTEMLLRITYEFPQKLPKPSTPTTP
jgi:hypothetical protein